MRRCLLAGMGSFYRRQHLAQPAALIRPTFWMRPAQDFLLSHALRIWRYFAQFSSERHHFLIPDNVVEDGRVEAARVSPTNIGLLLNARQAACELGFLTVRSSLLSRIEASEPSLASRSFAVTSTIGMTPKPCGNWETAPFISSVDNGNFLASLYTLRAGADDLKQKPLLHPGLFSALRSHWQILRKQKQLPASLSRLRMPRSSATMAAWIEWLPSAEAAFSAAAASHSGDDECSWWLNEMLHRLSAISTLLRDYLPWLLPEYKPLRKKLRLSVMANAASHSVQGAISFAQDLENRLAADRAALLPPLIRILFLPGNYAIRSPRRDRTCALWRPTCAPSKKTQSASRKRWISRGLSILAVRFSLSATILRSRRLNDSCYDLFASEARLATFLAVATYALPQQSWFRLEREHTFAEGNFQVLSWTGTMFEYLMPGLWMHSHPGTLGARNEASCVRIQRAFARRRRIPWGISESGTARRNDSGDYGYHAYGVPSVAISPDAVAGPVISPYSTFLALGVDPPEALCNLHRMESEGWVGPYGSYEAADYLRFAAHPCACARVDGPSSGNVAAGRHQSAAEQYRQAMVPCQPSGPGESNSYWMSCHRAMRR